jgi:hypothetical protein
MARVRSVDFLPEIFRTDANKQFLAATLDQLIQEPKFKKTQGYIGRTVGPGVNPNDRYVVEPSKTRSDYQLEPTVINLQPDTDNIQNAITYPGINDAIALQGGNSTRPDRLYQSNYYTWDPFIDFDSFVNFSQYYWLPNGPDAVEVAASTIPTTDNFVVNREDGVYTFSGLTGNNPNIELVRGGSYTFQVAQNNKETVNYRVGNQGTAAYVIDFVNNPALTLVRGNTYVFNLNTQGVYPFWIKTAPTTGTGDAYNTGVSRNGSAEGLVTFVVPQDAPNTLYYISQNIVNMGGQITVVDAQPGTGPGFWIQTNPGLSGKIPTTPNISSRDVFGVSNNGEDLGIVTFDVPTRTAQEFYYNLDTTSQPVDLVTDLEFSQINNARLDLFVAQYGGIDGITSLAGRNLVFLTNNESDEAWERTSFFDPLTAGTANNGLPGSYDTTLYAQATVVPVEDRRQIWQINYVIDNGLTYLNLTKLANIEQLQKFSVRFGTVYSNTNWYKTNIGEISQIPLLTANLNTLYYQDGTDPEIFGRITLLDQPEESTLFINNILGATNYISPNGVAFTNGLKVVFRGDVRPASYKSGTTEFLCTNTTAGTNTITVYSTADLYPGLEVVFIDPVGGLISGATYYVSSVVNLFEFTVSTTPGGLPVTLTTTSAEFSAIAVVYKEYYVDGVGTGIRLLPVTDFVTPEPYVEASNDSSLPVPEEPDYFTIDRSSRDLNAWSRSNRWFHIDVINATAQYNGTVATLDNNFRAKRAIIQFRPDLKLFNMGTEGKQPVDIIDFDETDALSNIQGATSYSVDGYSFVNGTRVIFAADEDNQVRNKIYVVEFITPDTVAPLIAQPIINLTLAGDGNVAANQSTLVLQGQTLQGSTYWYDGITWIQAQQKTAIQQAPLFDVYDAAGISFGNLAVYPSSNFVGSKLFSYAIGDSGQLDAVLKMPLKYLNIANVGDIVFDNNLYTDTFVYTRGSVSATQSVSDGFVREYSSRTEYQSLIGWQNAATTSQIYQQFKFTYSDRPLLIDVRVDDVTTVPVLKIYVGSQFVLPSDYTYTRTENTTTIVLSKTYTPDDVIEVSALSQQTSKTGFYQVPINLENNPLNSNSSTYTLGTVRQHYQSICENLPSFTGSIAGSNNTRDLGNLVPYGLVILQQSSPMTMLGYFMRSEEYNIFNSLVYNSREYIKIKNLILNNVTQQLIQFETPAQILDEAIETLTAGKVDTQPFYWTDMLPSGAVYTDTNYTVSFTTTDVFDTVQVHDYTSSNYLGMNVYLNGEILTRNLDYVVATDGPRITVLTALTRGDQLTIREYTATYGSFVPNTPTKMGLYPAWRPEMITIQATSGPQSVIVGHDGSITPVFGDIRDDVLLEFETRIFNNIKMDGNPIPLSTADVIPGQFRDTGYSVSEVDTILNQQFLSYVAWNKLDYNTQDYSVSNQFTWNYSTAQSKLNGEDLPGAWRGIYQYYYDTQQPQLTPWEMLGLSVKPLWWDDTYGPAPYTSGNLVLWDDLEAGYVRDPVSPYFDPQYARPGLTDVIPTGEEGNLLSPFESVVGTYNDSQFRKSWSLNDGGPVQASWYNSSDYPFAVMRLLALTRSAEFFALFADRDLYRYNTELDQYLYNNRYRLDANGVEVYGNGVSKASYINWIVDYNRQSGLDSTEDLTANLASLDVRLSYRLASFSDKQYIKVFTEKSSPNSTNTTFLIPDESYNLVLYKNQPFERVSYSSVLVQQVPGGYAVFGYSTTQPYFSVLQSRPNGQLQTISVAGASVRVPTAYSNTVVQIPYGYIFNNTTSVVDFLLSLGEYYEAQGLVFDNIDNGYVLSWNQMSQEFLYWSQQGWSDDAIINLNPLATKLSVSRDQAVVDSIQAQTSENVLLDQNRQELPTRNVNVVRIDNTFTVQPLVDQTLSFVELKYTSYEHMIVLDNVSVFGDLIYDPTTGARQSRLNLVMTNSSDWNGSVDAQGFILNQDNVEEWTGARTYSKGEIVRYKNRFWSAATIVQPSAIFNFNDWLQSEYEQIEQGLLPNLANKADQLQNSYNINTANLDAENDLFSYGLIGFRPREYMAALNLDDVSQINVYRQFLGSKGTILSAELFKQADLGKESAEYDIYENWAVQRAVYGANANRSYVELRLNRALLSASPSLIQVTNPQEPSVADQQIFLSNVWKQSFKLTSPDYLPTTTELPTDVGLPGAGYVNLDDVDITVFDINDSANIAANIEKVVDGATIWAAKVNNYDWNVYQCNAVPGIISHVCDNLDFTSRVVFSQQHGLAVGDKLIIKYFDSEVDGVYDVLTVPGLTEVTIAFQFAGNRTVANGNGIGFTLNSLRVAQASDVVNLPYANTIDNNLTVWVDNNGSNLWEVLEKEVVFNQVTELAPKVLDAREEYGRAISQATNQFAAMVGSPNYLSGTAPYPRGSVYVYVKDFSSTYQPVSPVNNADAILTLDVETSAGSGVPAARGYGFSVDFGSTDWAVAGAPYSLGSASQANNGYAAVIYRDQATYTPGTNPYSNWQLLTSPDSVSVDQGKFGYSVAMSQDERWMYVGAPAVNRVYAYGRVDWQDQTVNARGNGVTETFSIGNTIKIAFDTQLRVTLDGAIQQLNTDYTVDSTIVPAGFFNVGTQYTIVSVGSTNFTLIGAASNTVGVTFTATGPGTGTGTASVGFTSVTFTAPPADNVLIAITRIGLQQLTTNGVTAVFGLSSTLYQVGLSDSTIDSFSVEINTVLQRPRIDYTFNATTKQITFTTPPGSADVVVVRAKGFWQYVGALTVAGLASDAGFGTSVSCTTDGRQVLIGTPSVTAAGQAQAGLVYVFDRNVQRFIYQGGSDIVFDVEGNITEPVSVVVNNQFLINETYSFPGDPFSFGVDGTTVIVNQPLSAGDIVEIETNQFSLVQQVSQNVIEEFSNFGQSVDICSYNCSLYVGAPQSSLQIYKGGIVERQVNQARVYGTITSTVANPTLTAGDTIRVNNIDVAVPGGSDTNLAGLAAAIRNTVPNTTATVTADGKITISVANTNAAPIGNKLQVAPGSIGSAFDDIGFDTFVYTQAIQSPYPQNFAQFGYSLSIDDSATSLVVGSPTGTTYIIAVWDNNTTDWDAGATEFFSGVPQSGAVYTYDYLASATPSVTNPGKFIFGTQVEIPSLVYGDNFGTAVNYNSGILWMSAPGDDIEDSSLSNFGRAYVWSNPTRSPTWSVRRIQQPTVDIRLLNSVFLYDQVTSATTEFLDFFNPLQGKILGAAQQNIDYIGAVDPAGYNAGPQNNRGSVWGPLHVGQVWWDISNVRFIDPAQDDIVYASRRWGQIFPGSTVDVYQWIESTVAPADYTGPGTPLNTLNFVVNTALSRQNVFDTKYYFWVRGISTVATQQGKTLSVDTVARYIENPRATGIAYLAPIDASTVAIYNCETLIEAQDTVLHIEFDRQLTNDNVHVEYELIPQDRSDGFLSDGLYRKFQDSLCGVDTAGNQVPDLNLSPAERYGVQFRPRQSMFVDRFAALQNYINKVNSVLAQYPISEIRSFNLLNSADPIPAAGTGEWDQEVANLEILGFQNIYAVPLDYRYLVLSDADNQGLWTIYQVESATGNDLGVRELVLVKVQNFNTPDYWDYVNWYRPGYNASIKPVAEVPTFSSLDTIDVPIGSSVKVTANAQGKFEIYLLTDTGWERVGLEDGTIRVSDEVWDYEIGRFGFDAEVFDAQYYDQEPSIETRRIIQAINEELLIDELAIERNRALILMFNFVLSEFAAPEWLVKTSLVDVDHKLRELLPFQNYSRDNQEFVLDYIQEVKPYHVQIREFNLKYFGSDTYLGDIADFDVPAYFNTSLEIPQFTSPILLPYEQGTAQVSNVLSDASPSDTIWAQFPYSQWYNNYLVTIDSITVVDGGSGYTEAPEVTIIGDAAQAATAAAVINSAGRVVAINLTSSGSGYRSQPTITFFGGNGVSARAYAVLSGQGKGQLYNTPAISNTVNDYNLVRSFKTTIKYDRYQYQTQVETWIPGATYLDGTLVRYDNRVWRAASPDSTAVSDQTFDPENWQPVAAADLSGVDRTMGYYVPGVNSPGLELPLLIDGIDYPGVQVWGDYFGGNAVIDADYQSSFNDAALGTRPIDVNVNGGEFIGPYEGHAPEELVNGSEFDTLDMRIYTRPGSDWQVNGHGFEISTVNYVYNAATDFRLSWADQTDHPVQVLVSNQTTGRDAVLDVDYFVNWDERTIDIIPGAGFVNGDIVNISVYELGGGSQLYRVNYIGSQISDSTVIVPVNTSEITDVAVFVNGEISGTPTWVPYIESVTWSITDTYLLNDVVNSAGIYYRAVQAVPIGIAITDTLYWESFVPTLLSQVTLATEPLAADGVAIVVFGTTTPDDYSWSTPQRQYIFVDQTIIDTGIIALDNSLQGTNTVNMIVTRNGLRLNPPAGIEWRGDGSSTSFGLPQRLGESFVQSSINASTDVQVWVNNELQVQSVGAIVGSYSVTNWDGSNTPGRQVVFNTAPSPDDVILIAVTTLAAYSVAGNTLQLSFNPNVGDVIAVTTWNDTAQQEILTQVFVGPVVTSIVVSEGFDSTTFDDGLITGGPGTFDYSVGVGLNRNDFLLQQENVVAGRLWVTLNGTRLFEGQDFTVENNYLILATGAIALSDTIVVTQFTDSIVPEASAFRIFQDMRGVQATYRITNATTTVLTQALSASADIAYVADAAALTAPNLPAGRLGVVTIDGERIMYRNRDIALNTLSGLRRGTAGTAAADHAVDAEVYDITGGNLLAQQYQDYVVSQTFVADGSTTVFRVTDFDVNVIDPKDSSTTYINDLVEVYVAGVRQYPVGVNKFGDLIPSQYPFSVTSLSELVIDFYTDNDPVNPVVAPPAGVEITVLQRRGTSWYNTGAVISASAMIAGQSYFIDSVGTTNFVAVGSLENTRGVLFTCTGPASGTGTVTTASDGVALQESTTIAARFLCGN